MEHTSRMDLMQTTGALKRMNIYPKHAGCDKASNGSRILQLENKEFVVILEEMSSSARKSFKENSIATL